MFKRGLSKESGNTGYILVRGIPSKAGVEVEGLDASIGRDEYTNIVEVLGFNGKTFIYSFN